MLHSHNMKKPRILIVDDDPELASMLARYLSGHGMEVITVSNGKEMDNILASERFDLALLDLMMPGEDGLSIARRIDASLPFIILSARGEESDRIVGLELGADDYLAKPFSARELTARIQAVLRRREHTQTAESEALAYCFGHFLLDAGSHTLTKDGERVRITSADFALLKIFCANPYQVLSRERLVMLAGNENRLPFERAIDVRITRLRRKIEDNPEDPCYIRTVRGSGYLFVPEGHE